MARTLAKSYGERAARVQRFRARFLNLSGFAWALASSASSLAILNRMAAIYACLWARISAALARG
jgi:hypothetical protein